MDDSKTPRPAGSRKISAFATATESTSVQAEITADDVLKLRPGWGRFDAEKFLRGHQEIIGHRMVVAGATVLLTLIEGREDDAN